jgi:hypothetical protein
MGQAGIATTLGHYLHDPIALLARMPRSPDPSRVQTGWILGMVPQAAQSLLDQGQSWLLPARGRQWQLEANVTLLPEIAGHSSFDPTVSGTTALLELLAVGQSIDAALRTLGWPTRLESQIKGALEELRIHAVVVGTQVADGNYSLTPPTRKHGHEALERCATDVHCWSSLAWIFGMWLKDWRARNRKGFSAAMDDWVKNVPGSSPLQSLPWRR